MMTGGTQDGGFELISGVLQPAECAALLQALETIPRSRAGSRHLMSNLAVSRLASDPRLLDIASGFLGSEAFPFRATLFDKSADSNWLVVWHQDTALPFVRRVDGPGWGPWSVKGGVLYAHAPAWALRRIVALRVHLDASELTNGPLRVIPGSHELGVLSDEQIAALARSQEAHSCLVPLGGILAMRPLLVHASSKSTSTAPRRVVHIEYADAASLAPGRELAVA